MIKRILVAAAVLVVLSGTGLYFWARAVLASDTVRVAVAAQLTKALGQPVTVGRISATVLPRVTMNLGDVAIGPAGRLTIRTLHVGTNFRALLSRRIEHGELRVTGMHADLPLPPLTIGAAADRPASGPSVQIVSIDAIVFREVELVSGDRTLRADLDLVPRPGGAWTIRRATLGAADADIEIDGEVADLTGPTGELTVKAKRLDIAAMLAFITDFSQGAGIASRPTAARATAVPMNILLNLQADSVLLGTLTLDAFKGRARLTPEAVTLDPIGFGAFAGTYAGSLSLALAEVPAFRLRGTLADMDMAAAMAFLGTPATMTGRLAGTIAVAGKGLAADNVRKTVRGQARVEVTDGTVKGLGLVRSVVLATSMRSDAPAATTDAAASERFTRLGATLALADGVARTDDLRFTSTDVLLSVAGTIRLDGSAVDLRGKVQLSDALSQQAGRDLVRYTQEGGRVTLPATVSGPADKLAVRIDVAGAAERAILNRASEELGKAIKRKLDGLFGK